jgi:hypothetical protein
MADNLLKQAIADAKQVKQLAAEAARIQLEEAFKPHLSAMISSHLRNEALNEDNDASSDIGSGLTVDEPAPKKPSKATSDSSHIENPGLEVDDVFNGTSSLPKKTVSEDFPAGPSDDEEKVDLTSPNGAQVDIAAPAGSLDLGTGAGDLGAGMGAGAGDPTAAPGGMGGGMGGAPDELDLEAIIRELELDSQGDMGLEEPQLGGNPAAAPAPSAPQMESFKDAQAGKRVDGAFDGSVNTDNLKETVAGVSGGGEFKDGKALPAVDGVNGGKKVSPGQEVTGTKAETMSEEIDLDEILREMAVEENEAVAEVARLKEENAALRTSLREHRDTVLYLRDRIQEQNVTQAKLIFTNKLFKNFDLKLEQKKSIVESFDRANSVREVKIVYTTLAENLNGTSSVGSKKAAARITESMASKPVGGTKPKNTQILDEGNAQVSRMQKLAGIIKK